MIRSMLVSISMIFSTVCFAGPNVSSMQCGVISSLVLNLKADGDALRVTLSTNKWSNKILDIALKLGAIKKGEYVERVEIAGPYAGCKFSADKKALFMCAFDSDEHPVYLRFFDGSNKEIGSVPGYLWLSQKQVSRTYVTADGGLATENLRELNAQLSTETEIAVLLHEYVIGDDSCDITYDDGTKVTVD